MCFLCSFLSSNHWIDKQYFLKLLFFDSALPVHQAMGNLTISATLQIAILVEVILKVKFVNQFVIHFFMPFSFKMARLQSYWCLSMFILHLQIEKTPSPSKSLVKRRSAPTSNGIKRQRVRGFKVKERGKKKQFNKMSHH